VTRATEEDSQDLLGQRREVRLQKVGREVVLTLASLVRNVKIYSPDNAVFLKPIESLRQNLNAVFGGEKKLNLQAVETNVYLNNVRMKFDFNALDTVRFLTQEFEQRDIGGFVSQRPVTSQEIRDFLHLFTAQFNGAAPEEGADGHRLPNLKLSRFARVKELLDKMQEEPDLEQKVDRKKYLLTVYARAVFFMSTYIKKARANDLGLPLAKAGRLVQDLVDLSKDQRTHFLGLTTSRSDVDYLPYHSVNTCLISIVFGGELGLDKRQLHDLGMAALFSQLGLTALPEQVLERRGRLTAEERRQVDLYPLRTAKAVLATRGIDKTTMMRIVAAYESRVDYAVPRRRPDGEVELVMPRVGLGLYGRIIAIAECFDALTSKRPYREAYGPSIGLALMASELQHRFDPALLRVFMKVMAIQPVRILDTQSLSLA
jgi:HD-GYP domain-containing protein (c-di-GMP phosphodiesterase class II)